MLNWRVKTSLELKQSVDNKQTNIKYFDEHLVTTPL